MDWCEHQRPGGLRLLTISRPGSQLVAVAICVRAGSRYDAGVAGVAHLLEHMLMSGTQHRSELEIHDAVDGLGGYLNAQAGKEYISFQCVLPAPDWRVGLEILAEILICPALDEEKLTLEKMVVLEEIRRHQDQGRILYALFAQTLWQHHPLRHPILGYPEQVAGLDDETLRQAYHGRFTTGNVVLAVCGNVAHQAVRDEVDARFAALPHGEPQRPAPAVEPLHTAPRLAHLTRETNQTYMMLGVPTVGIKHPDRSALKILERVLGMGIGARLYRRLRNELRLVYDVTTAAAHYEDAGYLAAYTTCHPKNVSQVGEAIVGELAALSREGVTAMELSKAKTHYVGTLARHFETDLAIASVAASEGLLNQFEPFSASIARIQAVTQEEVAQVAARWLNTQGYAMVTVGPPESETSGARSAAPASAAETA